MEALNLLDIASTHSKRYPYSKSQFTRNPKTNRNIKLQRCSKCTHNKENDPKYSRKKHNTDLLNSSELAKVRNRLTELSGIDLAEWPSNQKVLALYDRIRVSSTGAAKYAQSTFAPHNLVGFASAAAFCFFAMYLSKRRHICSSFKPGATTSGVCFSCRAFLMMGWTLFSNSDCSKKKKKQD